MNSKSNFTYKNNYSFNKILLLNILFIIFVSFIITDNVYAQNNAKIKGYVIWEYNEYRENEPDTGTKIYLFKKNSKKYDILNIEEEPKGIYYTQVGPEGKFQINNIKAAKYTMLIVSENTTRYHFKINFDYNKNYSKKTKELKNVYDQTGDLSALHKSILYGHYREFKNKILKEHIDHSDYDIASWKLTKLNQFEIKELTLEPGEIKEINKDFGKNKKYSALNYQ